MVRLKAPKLQSLVLRMQTRYDQIKVRYDQIRARNRRLEVNNQTLLANHEQEVIAQRDLEASLSRYADLYDFAPGGYVCLDSQGIILEMNLSAAALLGAERLRLIGTPFQSLVSAANRRLFRDHLFYCRSSREPVSAELTLDVRPEDRRFIQLLSVPVRDPLRQTMVLNTSITDLTAQQLAQRALAEGEEQYRLVFDSIPFPAWIINRETHLFVAVNQSAVRDLGYSRDEFAAMSAKDIRSGPVPAQEQSRSQGGRTIQDRIASGFLGVLRYRRKDGTQVSLEIIRNPIVFRRQNCWLVVAREAERRPQAGRRLEKQGEREKAVARKMIEAQESERRHIARELHDQVGQVLTALKLSLNIDADASRERVEDDLQRAENLINELAARVRDMALDLRPSLLDDLGLLPALLCHLDRYTEQTGVRVTFKHAGIDRQRFDSDVETAAYRIIQEGLTNVARHANVKDATVRVWADRDRLHVQVEDSGRGFDAETAFVGPKSQGLIGARERARLLGGDLNVESSAGAGARLTADMILGEDRQIETR
jgi:PAS domain S-box-containing protein